MKKIIFFLLLSTMGILPLYSSAQIFNSQPPAQSTGSPSGGTVFGETTPDPLPTQIETPIDGGVVFLILIGMVLTIVRIRKYRAFSKA